MVGRTVGSFATGQCLGCCSLGRWHRAFPWAMGWCISPQYVDRGLSLQGLFLNNCTKICYYRQESHVQVLDFKQLSWLISQYSVNFSGNWFQSSGTCLWEGLQFLEVSSKINQMLLKTCLFLCIKLMLFGGWITSQPCQLPSYLHRRGFPVPCSPAWEPLVHPA